MANISGELSEVRYELEPRCSFKQITFIAVASGNAILHKVCLLSLFILGGVRICHYPSDTFEWLFYIYIYKFTEVPWAGQGLYFFSIVVLTPLYCSSDCCLFFFLYSVTFYIETGCTGMCQDCWQGQLQPVKNILIVRIFVFHVHSVIPFRCPECEMFIAVVCHKWPPGYSCLGTVLCLLGVL